MFVVPPVILSVLAKDLAATTDARSFASTLRMTTATNKRYTQSHTEYLTFNIPERMALVNITPRVQQILEKSGVREGLVLCNADAHHRIRLHQRR